MNDVQMKRSWRIGLGALGLIPIAQLCYIAYFAWSYQRNGIDFVTVLSDPPPSVFVMLPTAAVVVALCLAIWVGVLITRTTIGLVHVSICQLVLVLMALHLTLVVLRTSGLAAKVSVIRAQNEQRTQNQASEAIGASAPQPQR